MMLLLAIGLATAALQSCIKNDIPYPRIQADFLSISVDDLRQSPQIDALNRVITLNFTEEANIYAVRVNSYEITPGASVVEGNLDGPINLERPYPVVLRLYQDYQWVIQGVQQIERYFTVDNQIGATVIDPIGRRVVVTVPESVDLTRVHVVSMKLGPTGSVTTPDLTGQYVDLTDPVEVEVNVHNHFQQWTIYAEVTHATVRTIAADAWTQVAWVYGAAEAGKDNGVEYRRQGADAWTRCPDAQVQHDGGAFCAKITGLDPLTAYEARAFSDTEKGAAVSFTTGAIVQVPNTDLDEWNLTGKVWNPWAEGATPYWDTGNKGATTLGSSNSVPTDDTSTGTGLAAKLETKFVGIGVIGKLAAGNLFVGSYVATDGTNGILSFGRPFTERPTRLRGWLKYNCTDISHSSSEMAYLKGRPDTCIVWCALIDSPEPFEIRTNPSNRQLFDPNGSYVVAYGQVQYGESVPNYIPFEFDLNYNSTSRVPSYILITASASKYGDYFTGGNGSILYVDDLELLYD